MPKVSNRSLGENSPNLVTLVSINYDGSNGSSLLHKPLNMVRISRSFFRGKFLWFKAKFLKKGRGKIVQKIDSR
jgi:hypothetical protein